MRKKEADGALANGAQHLPRILGVRWQRLGLVPLALTIALAGALRGAESEGASLLGTEVQQLVKAAASYQSGQSMQPLRRLEELTRQSVADPELRKAIELELAGLLTAHSTLEAKQFACQILATVGTEISLPALGELLNDAATVSIACQSLGGHPSEKASAVLRKALGQTTGEARQQVISTLAARQDAESVPALIGLAKDRELATASAAVLALGRIATAPAREAIETLKKDSRPELRPALLDASMHAAEKLAAAGEAKQAAALYEELLDDQNPANVRRGAFEALLQSDEDLGEERIIRTLRGTDSLLIPVAIARIRVLRSEEASKKFAAVLPELSDQAQVWMVETLGGRSDAAARAAVESSLDSTKTAVRMAAIEALARAGDASAAGPLLKRLKAAPQGKEKSSIQRALVGMGKDSGVDSMFIKELEQATSSPAAQVILIEVLARRESRAAFPALLMATENPAIAEAAFEALGSLATAKDVPVLLGKLLHLREQSVRLPAEAAVAQALDKLENGTACAEALLEALHQAADLEAACSVLRLLPLCDDARALAALTTASTDAQSAVRDTAIRALVEWPDDRAWNVLLETVRTAEAAPHRTLAFNALVRLVGQQNSKADDALIGRFRTLLTNARTDDERKRILGALAGVAHPQARELVMPLLSMEEIRAEAQVALQRIDQALIEAAKQ